MSRIGKQPITIPQGVDAEIKESLVIVKGPKGVTSVPVPKAVTIREEEGAITVTVTNPSDHRQRALWGTTNRLIGNAMIGVTNGFTKKLLIAGVGYRGEMKGATLVLEVGFTHTVEVTPDEGVTISLEGQNTIIISGIDKQRVGSVASRIRAVKKPEPYKGKGIAYEGEVIKRKAGKQAAGAAK